MKKKKIALISGGVILLILLIWFGGSGKQKSAVLIGEVKQGEFEVVVTVTGELMAKNAEKVMGPMELRTGRGMRLNEIKIQDLVPEGTVVDSGAYVATLDRTAVLNSLRDIETELIQQQSSFERAVIDTTMSMIRLREAIKELAADLEDKTLTYQQSIYEPKATQRQTQIAMEKTVRALAQAKSGYILEKQKADASMRIQNIDLEERVRNRQEIEDVMNKFVIYAPKKGMVIYYRMNDGTRRRVGSAISPWDLTVATLPDLTVMNSRTYVNEIDISKVKKGMNVRIGVDAFPEKKFTGIVTSVANVGEQLPNTDAKVFEVIIQVKEYDAILRPSMTTSNSIIIKTFPDVKYLPLEAIRGMDSIPVVYKTSGTRQVVVLGESNENQVVVEQGLDVGDKVYLSTPEGAETWKRTGDELIKVISDKKAEQERLKLEAEKAAKAAEAAFSNLSRGTNLGDDAAASDQAPRQGGRQGGGGGGGGGFGGGGGGGRGGRG